MKFEILQRNIFGTYVICDWEAESREQAIKEFSEANPRYTKKSIIIAIQK